ncbi:MAG: DUF2007 domain-containing protein [Bacteroidales bacterium]|nr:DUF2007 domain-containing protein [Bacteroidales bacterium]
MAIIKLTSFNTSTEAHLFKAILEDNEIRCFLTNENFSSLMPHYNGIMGSGIQIWIDEQDLEAAQEILSKQRIEKEKICPYCGSTNIGFGLSKKRKKKIWIIILSLFAGIPFGNIKNTYYCKDCSETFDF